MIWIDIDNAPHVLIFKPFIERLKKDGIEVLVTARDYGNVVQLLDLFHISYYKIGEYGGKNKVKKILNLIHRSMQLITFVNKRKRKVKLSLNHGSRSHCIASKLLGITTISMIDYEYTELSTIKFGGDYFLVSEFVNKEVLWQKGFKKEQIFFYPSLKEDLYLWSFSPRKLSFVPPDKIIVVLRPPSFTANYFVKENKNIFDKVIKILKKRDDLFIICVPRTKEQEQYIKQNYKLPTYFFIPDKPLNGVDLLYTADVVISGGGTMNREATLFGCLVYSIFKGQKGGVDSYLEKEAKIKFVENPEDLVFKKKEKYIALHYSHTFEKVYNFILKNIY